ncbi:MAG: single-stranded-DNA-specific exonuclease RecJ, partial [Burkholderiales bacterium]
GYGLTPGIVDIALARSHGARPELLVTVDNGIASVEGVAHARAHGMQVLITDHHLPGPELPAADAIVTPNRPGCSFPSKHLAGVGVAFYVLAALRAELRRRGRLAGGEPALGMLLDLVALGTVADVVRLDRNNRVLVAAGLKRIRAGRACPGITALMQVAGREARRADAFDLGFALGPRINAAGRLADMSVGIECLLTDDPSRAAELARDLDAINRERREIEQAMQLQANDAAEVLSGMRQRSLVVYRSDWHQGVVGLVASRLKERYHRPVVAFAPADAEGQWLRGSGRSIAGVHLRDVLDLVTKRQPQLIERFGGHAMAAGLTIPHMMLEPFAEAFEQALAESVEPRVFERVIETDGELAPEELSLASVELIDGTVWGQGFPPPSFEGVFEVLEQRVVGTRHLRLRLRPRAGRATVNAIAFNRTEPLERRARLVYALRRDEYRGPAELSLHVSHAEPA